MYCPHAGLFAMQNYHGEGKIPVLILKADFSFRFMYYMYTFKQVPVEARGTGLPEIGVIGCWRLPNMSGAEQYVLLTAVLSFWSKHSERSNRHISPRTNDIPGHWFFISFTVPGMNFLLWNRPQIH